MALNAKPSNHTNKTVLPLQPCLDTHPHDKLSLLAPHLLTEMKHFAAPTNKIIFDGDSSSGKAKETCS
jgi:hypothetical protein